MDNDAFGLGVAPGGLRDRSEIKLMVCYLLKNLDRSLTRVQINDILQLHGIANYFEINSALSELITAGQVTSEINSEGENIAITPKAKLDVAVIERDLPRSIREKAVNSALKILARDRIKKESKVEVTAHKDGFHVKFIVTDVDTELLRITVFVADEGQVETVKDNFYNNATDIYSNLISSLTVR